MAKRNNRMTDGIIGASRRMSVPNVSLGLSKHDRELYLRAAETSSKRWAIAEPFSNLKPTLTKLKFLDVKDGTEK